jgi:hypothetical protein
VGPEIASPPRGQIYIRVLILIGKMFARLEESIYKADVEEAAIRG